MQQDKLKPCPFCGGKAELVMCDNGEIPQIRCSSCLALMGWHCGCTSALKGQLNFDTKEEAITAWNRRKTYADTDIKSS